MIPSIFKKQKYVFCPSEFKQIDFMDNEFRNFLNNNQIKYTYRFNGEYIIYSKKDLNYILLVYGTEFITHDEKRNEVLYVKINSQV